MQFSGNVPERRLRIGHVHQIDVTGQKQLCHFLPSLRADR
jgi:hypothetical protein